MNTKELQEQIQEDIITFMDDKFVEDGWDAELLKENLCQIVVDNFKKLDDVPKELITEGDKKLKAYLANQQFFNDTYDTGGY